MSIPEAYVVAHGRLSKFLQAIQGAGVPDRVTVELLKSFGFSSSNDRGIIRVMKAIGFLDSHGSPTSLYKRYRDKTMGRRVLAEALRTAYSDLFLVNTKANELAADKLRGIVATKTEKGERVVKEIVATFKALCTAADFSDPENAEPIDKVEPPERGASDAGPPVGKADNRALGQATFHYNIQIHLPTTTDISVYNAIFKSLREHLL